MKIFYRITAFCLVLSFIIPACQKEYSLETGVGVVVGEGTAEGTLGGSPTGCTNTQISGVYAASLIVDSTNAAMIAMDFTVAGTYLITTDTVNGFYFSNTGVIGTTGPASVTLKAHGTPASTGNFTFTVKFKGSVCSFVVNVFDLAPSAGTDYFPTTANSFWKYFSSDPSATPADTLLKLSTSDIFGINSNNYNLFTSSNSIGKDSMYFRKTNGEYHEFGDMDVAGAASNVVASDYIFLKDNVPAGSTWDSPEGDAIVSSATVKLKLSFTITEKGVNVQLGNAVFKDVIKVTTIEQVQLPAGYTPILTYETWYAKGIGIVNLTAAPPLYGYQVQQYQIF